MVVTKSNMLSASDKPSKLNKISTPLSFKSDLRTLKDSFNSRTPLSALPTDWCCCGAAQRSTTLDYSPSHLPPFQQHRYESFFEKTKCSIHVLVSLCTQPWSSPQTTKPRAPEKVLVMTRIFTALSRSSLSTSPRVDKNAKSAWISLSRLSCRLC